MFGYTAGGWAQYEAYRPSIHSFSDSLTKAVADEVSPASQISVPYGWDFTKLKDNVILDPSQDDFVRYVKAFGLIAHLGDSSSDDTPSAFTATAVLKLPFRFGEKEAEALPSWVFARVSAFASKAFSPKITLFLPFHLVVSVFLF